MNNKPQRGDGEHDGYYSQRSPGSIALSDNYNAAARYGQFAQNFTLLIGGCGDNLAGYVLFRQAAISRS